MPDQVPNQTKQERAHRAAQVAQALQQAYLESWVGQELPILFEEEKDHLWRGHAPNYVEVWVDSSKSLHNTEKAVRITGVRESSLLGTLL